MKAIILAAGRGSRMKKATDEVPKCLVSVRGKPLLDWQIEALHRGGMNEIAIVTGYRKECLQGRGLVEFHNPRWEYTNMVTSLAAAEEWLRREPCIVSYSDIFYQAEAVTSLMECRAPLAVTYSVNWQELWEARFGDPLLDAETFRLNANGSLAEIGRQPRSLEEIEGQYMGLLRIEPKGWAAIEEIRNQLLPQERDRLHMTGTLQKIIEQGRLPISAVPYSLDWGEVDNEADVRTYNSTQTEE